MTTIKVDRPVTAGVDQDGVINLMPFGLKQAMLTPDKEKTLWRLQQYWPLQRIYNSFFRKPNQEVKAFMRELKGKGVRIVIISASNEAYRQELEIWLKENDFCFDALILKEDFKEDCRDYKKRLVPALCDCYLDDKEEIVQAINSSEEGKCRAILYRGQTSKELLREFFPVFA
jgi:hypothetical protein